MERDVYKYQVNEIKQISTHTLTWSVTWILSFLFFCRQISTHTLTWSVTIINR